MTLEQKLKELEGGLVCLVPKKGSGEVITSHEKTHCDCTFLNLLAALRLAREQRDYYQCQLNDMDVGNYGSLEDDDAALLAVLEGRE